MFACVYMAMLLVWQFKGPTERFMVPLFPLLLAGLSLEIANLYSGISKALRSPNNIDRLVAVLAAGSLSALFYVAVSTAHDHIAESIPAAVTDARAQLSEARLGYGWISKNLPPDAAFLAEHDTLLFLYTGRRATTQPQSTKPIYRSDEHAVLAPIYRKADFAREQGLSYYFLERDDLAPEVRQKITASADFKMVYGTPAVSIFQIQPPHPTP